jgi:putative transposase
MSHSINKLWVHAIWSTKNREHLLHSTIEQKLYDYITGQLKESGCSVRIINGMPDHVHCLFLLNPQKSISEVMKQIKGSSSHYINKNDLITEKFAWQTGYAAFSISESISDRVYFYIKNQKNHHQKKNFQDEYSEFMKLYGFTENG